MCRRWGGGPNFTVSADGPPRFEDEAALGVGPGDRVDFVRMEDGNFAVLAATQSVKQLKGLIRKPKRAVSLENMARAIAEGAKGS